MKKILTKEQVLRHKGTLASLLILLLLSIFIVSSFSEKTRAHDSEHFRFIVSDELDSSQIKVLEQALESNYSRISKNLNTVPADSMEVFIYNRRLPFVKATGYWTATGCIQGPSQLHFMHDNWMNEDTRKVAVHEFAHAVNLQLLLNREPDSTDINAFEQKFSTFPIWLWEGLASYEAGQLHNLKTMPFLANGKYPTLDELNKTNKGMKIYKVGYTIIEYIVTHYGQDKLVELIASYGNLQTVLGVTEAQFEKAWYAFIKEKYLS